MKPTKKVGFSETLETVHVLHAWSFAYRQARIGIYKQQLSDRMRFNRRIRELDVKLGPVLNYRLYIS